MDIMKLTKFDDCTIAGFESSELPETLAMTAFAPAGGGAIQA